MRCLRYLKAPLVLLSLCLLWFSGLAFVFGATVSSTVTTTAQAGLTQAGYRWYENVDALTPTTALGSANTSIDVVNAGTVIRLRLGLDAGANFGSGLNFKLQFSSSVSSGFTDLGTSTPWIFFDNPGVADGQTILTTLLSGSNVGESYDETNPSAATPSAIANGERAEWDWVVKNNSASTGIDWYFRMVFSSSTVLDSYSVYPKLSAVASSSSGGGPTTVILPGGGGGPTGPVPTSTKPVPPRVETPCDSIILQRVDFSGDCKVDIVDLSILLFYYERSGSEITRYDLNDNNIIDFPDVSVLMFYWTG